MIKYLRKAWRDWMTERRELARRRRIRKRLRREALQAVRDADRFNRAWDEACVTVPNVYGWPTKAERV